MRSRRIYYWGTAFLMALVLLCTLGLPVSVNAASKNKLNKSKVTITVGKTTTLSVSGSKKSVTWKSSKPDVATVSSKGKVKGISAGKSVVTATVKINSKKTTKLKCTVTVKKPTISRKLNLTSADLDVGQSVELLVANAASTDEITYTSGNSAIATVDEKGNIKGVEVGTTEITVDVLAKNTATLKLRCKVNVGNPPVIDAVTFVRDGDLVVGRNSVRLKYTVDSNTKTTVTVYDISDQVVYAETANVTKGREQEFVWDGKSTSGGYVSAGSYYFEITARSTKAKSDVILAYTESPFSGGTGAKTDPYVIKTADEFKEIVKHNYCSYILGNDIDAQNSPLGGFFSIDNPYHGNFDGKGYTISNIMNSGVGIFTAIGEDAEIKNLNLSNYVLTNADQNGVLVSENNGVISDCNVTVSVTGKNCAGIAYKNNHSITNCKVSGKIVGSLAAAGVAVKNAATGKIISCVTDADVTSNGEGYVVYNAAAGIANTNEGFISQCGFSGTLAYDSYHGTGATCAAIATKNQGTISSCYYSGTEKYELVASGNQPQ